MWGLSSSRLVSLEAYLCNQHAMVPLIYWCVKQPAHAHFVSTLVLSCSGLSLDQTGFLFRLAKCRASMMDGQFNTERKMTHFPEAVSSNADISTVSFSSLIGSKVCDI